MILPVALKNILDDNLSGSVTLLNRLMIALENELLNPELDPATFISYVEIFRKKLELFTVVRHFCDELVLTHTISVRNDPAKSLEFISNYRQFWENAPVKILANLQKYLDLNNRTIMLHSNSGTLREVFRLMTKQENKIHFYQTLSAPMEEGKIQARDLAAMGYRVTLIADAMAAEKLKSCDYLVLAADQLRSHSFINKVGTYQMAAAAQELNVPVLLLTESRKLNLHKEESSFEDRSRDPAELGVDIQHQNIHIENRYLEEIPRRLVTKIITEREDMDLIE